MGRIFGQNLELSQNQIGDTLDFYYFLIIFYVWDTSLMCGILVDDDDDDDDRHTLDPTPPSSPSHTGKKHGVRPRILT